MFTGDQVTRGRELFQAAASWVRLDPRRRLPVPTSPPLPAPRRRGVTAQLERAGGRCTTAWWPIPHQPAMTRPERWSPPTIRPARSPTWSSTTPDVLRTPDAKSNGLRANFITDPSEITISPRSSPGARGPRPPSGGHNYTYTNNWPSEPRVDNGPTADLVVWSRTFLVALLGGTGIMFAVYGRWSQKIGWHASGHPDLHHQPGGHADQIAKATVWFFAVISVLFPRPGAAGRTQRTTAPTCPASSASTWPSCCLQPGPHLASAAGPCCLDRRAFLAGIFLTPFITGANRRSSTCWSTYCWARWPWWCSDR